MTMKVKVSYTDDEEAKTIIDLMKPIKGRFKVKKNNGKPPYKHLYFIPKNGGKAHH